MLPRVCNEKGVQVHTGLGVSVWDLALGQQDLYYAGGAVQMGPWVSTVEDTWRIILELQLVALKTSDNILRS